MEITAAVNTDEMKDSNVETGNEPPMSKKQKALKEKKFRKKVA